MLKRTPQFPPSLAGERTLDRRRFLGAAACAALAAAAGEWLGGAAAHSLEEPFEVALPAAPALAAGEARALTGPGGREALVVRVDADTVVAFDRRCPHLGCPVLWSAERERFECPCHHAAFDGRSGAVLFGPPQRGLTPARIRHA